VAGIPTAAQPPTPHTSVLSRPISQTPLDQRPARGIRAGLVTCYLSEFEPHRHAKIQQKRPSVPARGERVHLKASPGIDATQPSDGAPKTKRTLTIRVLMQEARPSQRVAKMEELPAERMERKDEPSAARPSSRVQRRSSRRARPRCQVNSAEAYQGFALTFGSSAKMGGKASACHVRTPV